jgi:hypothetical protein
LAERIQLHTCTVTELLKASEEPISKFVLLDHMDWMSSYYPDALAEEWSYILRRATPDARIIFRSAHAAPAYLGSLEFGAKRKVKGAVSFIFDFEESVVRCVKECGVDGVICGHIHVAAIKDLGGTTYINCGDWVDSCTAVVEHEDGSMELIEWAGQALQTEPEVVRLTDAKSRPAEVEPAPVPAVDGMPADRPAAGLGRSAT